MKPLPLFAVAAVFVACADDPYDPDAPAIDRSSPRVEITSPARGAVSGDIKELLVTGTVTDDAGAIESVTVNGMRAVVAADGTWTTLLAITPGTSLVRAVAVDAQGNEGSATRAIVAGPMVGIDQRVAGAIRTTLSARALDATAHDIAAFIEEGGLMNVVANDNPVVKIGEGPCFYARATVTNVQVASADVKLTPTTGAVRVATTLENVRVDLRLQWAAPCTAQGRDAVLTAERVTVQGPLTIGVVDRKLDVQFDKPNVQVTGFAVTVEDVPEEILSTLKLDGVIGPLLGLVTERLAVPMMAHSLRDLDARTTLADAGGILVDVAMHPARVELTPEGGTIALDLSARARGDHGNVVYLPSPVPTIDTRSGFETAVSDNALNQLLTSLWSTNAFDFEAKLDAHTDEHLGKYYDTVQLELAAPPHIDANGSPLQLTVGDWIATFSRRGTVVAKVAIHARSALYAAEGDDGRMRLAVSTPTATIDVLEEGEPITNEQYKLIRKFAVERLMIQGGAAVSAIPLPVVGKAVVTSPWVEPRSRHLFLVGTIIEEGL
jgi:hypothetical protein